MADIAKLRTKDITSGLTLRLLLPNDLSVRMKLGAWLIGLAGRVMHMPCEVEIVPTETLARRKL